MFDILSKVYDDSDSPTVLMKMSLVCKRFQEITNEIFKSKLNQGILFPIERREDIQLMLNQSNRNSYKQIKVKCDLKLEQANEIILKNKRLTHLFLSNIIESNEDFFVRSFFYNCGKLLTNLSNLYLDFLGSFQLGHENHTRNIWIKQLSSCRKLKNLTIKHFNIKDDELKEIIKLEHLQFLKISFGKISSNSLEESICPKTLMGVMIMMIMRKWVWFKSIINRYKIYIDFNLRDRLGVLPPMSLT